MRGGQGLNRPRLVVAIWIAAIALLGALGATVEGRLHQSDLVVPGSGAHDARKLAERHFGDNHTLVVMVEGPARQVDAQGRRLAQRLDRRPGVAAVGPWVPGAGDELRPRPDRALVMVRADMPFEEVSEKVVPLVRSETDRTLREPVQGYVTGYADVGHGVHKESIKALQQAELIAAPLLLIVLLLVFRSPVAAMLPLGLGIATIVTGRGLLDIVNRFVVELDVSALSLASMMGLALGVDYALVIVSRFREELDAGMPVLRSARTAVGTAGRTVLFAGITLFVAMLASLFVAPGNVLASAGIGVLSSVLLSVAAAVTLLPALLVLLGRRVNQWSFGQGSGDSRWGTLALRAIRRPALAAVLVLGLLAALAWPALSLNMGSPDPRALPASSPHRQDFEHVYNTMKGGWSAPYEVVIATERGRITDPERLRAVDRWQERAARDRDVLAVMGPGAIADRTRRLASLERGLRDAGEQFGRARRDQRRLEGGLTKVRSGVAEMRGGLSQAADGAGRLESGSGETSEGADRLRAGLARAESGAEKLIAGLAEARAGAGRLEGGGQDLRRGAERLRTGLASARRRSQESLPQVAELRKGLEEGRDGLEKLREPTQRADAELKEALDALGNMLPTSKGDPQYPRAYESVATASGAVSGRHPITGRPVAAGYDGLDAELAGAARGAGEAAAGVRRLERGSEELVAGLGRMETGASRLGNGAARLENGARELLAGLRRLEDGGSTLTQGLGRLSDGGDQLAAGAAKLEVGAGRLAGGLGSGAERTEALESGVSRMHGGVVAARGRTDRLGRQLGGNRVDTRLFDSGYLPLAALDKARPSLRTGSTFAINLDRGGTAARIVVIEDGEPTRELRERMERSAERLERDTGMQAGIGGPAALLQDFESASSSRVWLLVALLALVTYLALVPLLRSLVLPLIAVLLNVATVAAAFGVLVLGFQGAAPLGGPGELDGMMVLAIVGIVFGLSIDYEVFLLARICEGFARTGTTAGAIDYGLRKTAGVITGAALIMTGVFVAFALSPVIGMRQLGVGLLVAVLLDATVVRLVLLPAAVKLAGHWNWWLPKPLDRLLPDLNIDGGDADTPDRNGKPPFARWQARSGDTTREAEVTLRA